MINDILVYNTNNIIKYCRLNVNVKMIIKKNSFNDKHHRLFFLIIIIIRFR